MQVENSANDLDRQGVSTDDVAKDRIAETEWRKRNADEKNSDAIQPIPTRQSSNQDETREDENQDTAAEEEVAEESSDIDIFALILLGAQEASSSFSYRAAEYAYSIYLVVLFTNTLLPASLYGFITTASAIVFSGSVGGLTDTFNTHRLRIVRTFIFSQKLLVSASYGIFLVLFYNDNLRQGAENGGRGPNPDAPRRADVWSCFAAITILGCILILCNVGVSVSVERDWVTSIAKGSSKRLTRLNAIMRRIDLLSKLVAPLFVSLLTTTLGYPLSCVVLLCISAFTTVFELSFIGIVFRRFTILGEEEQNNRHKKRLEKAAAEEQTASSDGAATYPPRRIPASIKWHQCFSKQGLRGTFTLLKRWAKVQIADWHSFALMPVFISSLAISLLYMSVLSFDSTFIAYLKSETNYTDPFIAGMRGVCVVCGLLGTFVSPYLTRKIGLVRTGTWSIWAELLPLSMAIVSFYEGASNKQRPHWNTALLFTGLSLSRIGLWSFDLAQLAQAQEALRLHPRRNALMGLQFALQNALDLLHYALTIIWSRPSQFKNAADVSFAAIGTATLLYTFVYARRERGHVLHLDKMGLESLMGRKSR